MHAFSFWQLMTKCSSPTIIFSFSFSMSSTGCKRCFAGRDESSICCFCEQLGRRIIHGCDGCPYVSKMQACRQCHQLGHLTKCCILGHPGYERPPTLESMIPHHLRWKYKITTHTKITWTDTDRINPDEIPLVNCFQVLDTYAGMKEFIDKYNIVVKKKTKESLDECRTAIEHWVRTKACRLEFISAVTAE